MFTLLTALFLSTSTPAIYRNPVRPTQVQPDPAAELAPITIDEINTHVKICLGDLSGSMSDDQITKALNDLDVKGARQERDFAVGCAMYLQGIKDANPGK